MSAGEDLWLRMEIIDIFLRKQRPASIKSFGNVLIFFGNRRVVRKDMPTRIGTAPVTLRRSDLPVAIVILTSRCQMTTTEITLADVDSG
jgi:hypothetical protein